MVQKSIGGPPAFASIYRWKVRRDGQDLAQNSSGPSSSRHHRPDLHSACQRSIFRQMVDIINKRQEDS